jgi:hypothetical protein
MVYDPVTSTPDAAVTAQGLNVITSRSLTELFEESPVRVEYLQHELYQYIQGWLSLACVRGISYKARAVWGILGREKRHPLGYRPAGDYQEMHRLFLWLPKGKGKSFATASSDVFCVTLILQENWYRDPLLRREGAWTRRI